MSLSGSIQVKIVRAHRGMATVFIGRLPHEDVWYSDPDIAVQHFTAEVLRIKEEAK